MKKVKFKKLDTSWVGGRYIMKTKYETEFLLVHDCISETVKINFETVLPEKGKVYFTPDIKISRNIFRKNFPNLKIVRDCKNATHIIAHQNGPNTSTLMYYSSVPDVYTSRYTGFRSGVAFGVSYEKFRYLETPDKFKFIPESLIVDNIKGTNELSVKGLYKIINLMKSSNKADVLLGLKLLCEIKLDEYLYQVAFIIINSYQNARWFLRNLIEFKTLEAKLVKSLGFGFIIKNQLHFLLETLSYDKDTKYLQDMFNIYFSDIAKLNGKKYQVNIIDDVEI